MKVLKFLSGKSNGVFIYARYAVEKLNPQSEMSIDELKEFPDGITGFYDIQFKRLLGGNYQHVEDNTPMWRIIEVVIAAQEPLHVETLEYLVNCTTVQRKSAVAQLSLLFPVRNQRLHVFHKSVKDWLVNVERKEETCFVNYKKVHKLMGNDVKFVE